MKYIYYSFITIYLFVSVYKERVEVKWTYLSKEKSCKFLFFGVLFFFLGGGGRVEGFFFNILLKNSLMITEHYGRVNILIRFIIQ